MVIFDVDINDMHRFVELAAPIKQILSVWSELIPQVKDLKPTIANGIVAPLFTSNDDISDLLTFLPSFGCQFYLPVSIKHLQQATSRISKAGMSLQPWMESDSDTYNLGSLAFNSS